VLQCVAEYVAVRCGVLRIFSHKPTTKYRAHVRVAVRVALCCRVFCSVLQCFAVCCRVWCSVLQSVLQCVAVCCWSLSTNQPLSTELICVLQYVLQYVLQCVAECVAVCCRVCCSALQCVASLIGQTSH